MVRDQTCVNKDCMNKKSVLVCQGHSVGRYVWSYLLMEESYGPNKS